MLGSVDTFVISYIVTGRLVFAASIASVETVTKIILFYGHERIWAAVPWGRADMVAHMEATHVEAAHVGVAPIGTTPIEAVPLDESEPAVARVA
jgi:uncharacterized membrane protein